MSSSISFESYSFVSPVLQQKIAEHENRNGILAQKRSTPDPVFSETESIISLSPNHTGSPREVWESRNPLNPNLLFSSNNEGNIRQRLRQRFQSSQEAYVCYENMKATDLFFRKVFSISPVPVGAMKAYLYHPDDNLKNNAAWIPGYKGVYFGNYNPKAFTSFALNLDITRHEFMHPFTEYVAGFEYHDQSGALNECISDIFTIMAKQYEDQTMANDPDANWFIADGLIFREEGDEGYGTALRSLSNPGNAYFNHPLTGGKDDQVKHMNSYDTSVEAILLDHGGVHSNSGIPNQAFYLAASQIGGYSWKTPGNIWLNALLHAQPKDDFATFAERTMKATRDLKYYEGIQDIVGRAWTSVGVKPSSYPRPETLQSMDSNFSTESTIVEHIIGFVGIVVLGVPSFYYSLFTGKAPTWGLDFYDRSQENASLFSPIR